jgi:2'-5' RNA ligase
LEQNYNNEGGGYRRPNSRPGGNRYGNKRPAPTGPRSMYYVTILCPLEIDEQIDAYKNMMLTQFNCEVAAKSPAHITLINPFFLSDGKYKDLVEKLEAFESIVNDISIEINGFNHFGNRVIFADVPTNDNLNAMQEQLENYLKNNGFPFIKEAKKPFHGHVTIATRDLKEEDFDNAWANFEGKEMNASFTTNAIHIMKLVDEKWVHDKQFILK